MNLFKTRRPVMVLVFLSVLVAPVGSSAAADLVIIGNPQLRVEQLEIKDLQRIYMGKQTRWATDEAIVPVMLKAGSIHEEFVEEYLDRSAHRFVTYWRQMVFTGKGIPPRSFATEKELVAFVAQTPGAVGYVSIESDVTEVRVVSIDRD